MSGKYNDGFPEGARFTAYMSEGKRQQAMARRFVNEKSIAATKAYMEIGKEIGLAPVTLATAWSKQHDFVASTIVGATHVDQLADIFAAADVVLDAATLKKINEVHKQLPYPMG